MQEKVKIIKMAKQSVIAVLVTLLLIQTIVLPAVQSAPVAQEGGLLDLETSANTIIFPPMFLYRHQQKRIQQRLKQKHQANKGGNHLK